MGANEYYKLWIRNAANTGYLELETFSHLQFAAGVNIVPYINVVVYEQDPLRSILLDANRIIKVTKADSTNGMDGTAVLVGRISEAEGDSKSAAFNGTPIIWTIRALGLAEDLRTILYDSDNEQNGTVGSIISSTINLINTRAGSTLLHAGTLPSEPNITVRFKNQAMLDILYDLTQVGDGTYIYFIDVQPYNEANGDYTPVVNVYTSTDLRYKTGDPFNTRPNGLIAWWKLDEADTQTYTDVIGGYTATYEHTRGKNYVKNSDFRNGTTDWLGPGAGVSTGATREVQTRSIDNPAPYGTSDAPGYVAHFVAPKDGTNRTSIYAQSWKVIPGRTYTISMSATATSIIRGTNAWNDFYVFGRWTDNNGTDLVTGAVFDLGRFTADPGAAGTSPAFGWTRLSKSATAPADAYGYRLYFGLSDCQGEAWATAVQFEEGGAATPYTHNQHAHATRWWSDGFETLPNGNFTSGTNGYSIHNGPGLTVPTTAEIVSDRVYAEGHMVSKKSLKVTVAGSGASGGLYRHWTKMPTARAGVTYRINAKIYLASGAMRVVDEATGASQNVTLKDSWTSVSFTSNKASGAHTGAIVFYNSNNQPATFYIDNFEVVEEATVMYDAHHQGSHAPGHGGVWFDGSMGRFFSNNTTLRNALSATKTFETWIFPTQAKNGTLVTTKNLGATAAGDHGWGIYATSNRNVAIQMSDSSGLAAGTQTVYSSGTVTLNKWNHVIVSYDADTKDVTFRINKVKEVLPAAITITPGAGAFFAIGGEDSTPWNNTGHEYGFAGIIDEPRFYNVVLDDETAERRYADGQQDHDEPRVIHETTDSRFAYAINESARIKNAIKIQYGGQGQGTDTTYTQFVSDSESISTFGRKELMLPVPWAQADTGLTVSGTVSVTSGSATVTGTGTSFLSQLQVGDPIKFPDDVSIYFVDAIASNTSLTITPVAGSTKTDVTLKNLRSTAAIKHASTLLNVLKGDTGYGIRRFEVTLQSSEFQSEHFRANLGDVIGLHQQDGHLVQGRFLYYEYEQIRDRLTVTAGLPRFQHLEVLNELKKSFRATSGQLTIPDLDIRYVNATGDSMTGTLTLDNNLVLTLRTPGRIPFIDSDKKVTDSSGLTWNSSTNTFSATNASLGTTSLGATTISGLLTLTNAHFHHQNASSIQMVPSGTALNTSQRGVLFDAGASTAWDLLTLKNSSGTQFYVSGAGDATVGRNLTVGGDLIVNGSTTTVNTTNLEIADNIIRLNKNETGAGVTAGTAGIEVERGTASDVRLVFDESDDSWKVSYDGGTTLSQLVELSRTQTLSGKTLTSPTINSATVNGMTFVTTAPVADGISYNIKLPSTTGGWARGVTHYDNATGATIMGGIGLYGSGTDSPVHAYMGVSTTPWTATKGLTVTTTKVQAFGVDVATVSDTQTFTNKTLTSPTITNPTVNGTVATTGLTMPAFDASGNIIAANAVSFGGKNTTGTVYTLLGVNNANNVFVGTSALQTYIFSTAIPIWWEGSTYRALADVSSAQTLSSKTISSPVIQGTVSSGTGLTFGDFTAGTVTTTNVYWGSAGLRIENMGADAATARHSGFYQRSAVTGDTNYPEGATDGRWYHGLVVRHSNTTNNYQMHLVGRYNDINGVWYGIVNNGTLTYKKLWHEGNVTATNGLSVTGNEITSNATSANTASTIVMRDSSGNFTANTITAALSGNATTATTLQTARTINGKSFNGSGNIELDWLRVIDNGSDATVGRAVNRATSEYSKQALVEFKTRAGISAPGSGTYSGLLTLAAYSDSTAGPTHAQFTWAGQTLAFRSGQYGSAWDAWRTVLFADDTATANTASKVVIRDASGNFSAGTITANLTGTASNASQLNAQDPSYYLAWANFSGKPTSAVADIDDAVSKRHTQGTDLGTTSVTFKLGSGAVAGNAGLMVGNGATPPYWRWNNDNTRWEAYSVWDVSPQTPTWAPIYASGFFKSDGTEVSYSGHSHGDIDSATSSNTVNTIVKRDASGNFSATTITAALTGNASTATKLATPRKINGVDFDGSAAITVKASTTSVLTLGSYLTGTSFDGSTAITAAVDATSANTASKVVARDSLGNFTANEVTLDKGLKTVLAPQVGRLSLTSTERGHWNPLWTAIAAGKPIYHDEEFGSGSNNVGVYNNSSGDGLNGVQHFRENTAISLDGGLTTIAVPNSTGYYIRIHNNGTGATSPGRGGFVQHIQSSENKVFVQRFRALIPVGKKVVNAENSQGTNANTYWITPQEGTGKWEEYIRVVNCGDSGTFSGGGHVYIADTTNTSATFTWYLASCNVYAVEEPLRNYFPAKTQAETISGAWTFSGNATTTGTLTANNNLVVGEGTNITLKANSTNSSDPGDLVFADSNGTELMRIYYTTRSAIRFGSSDTAKSLYHSGDADAAATADKLVLRDGSGNINAVGIAASGTLSVTSDVAVNTNKFTVTATSGNTYVAGTLGVGAAVGGASNAHFNKSWTAATTGEQHNVVIATSYNIADSNLKQGLRLNTLAGHTTGTLNDLIGVLALTTGSGNGGTTTKAYGYWARVDASTGHAVTNSYGLAVHNGAGAGTVGTQYGVYVGALSKGTTNYAIYTDGTTPSYFGGTVSLLQANVTGVIGIRRNVDDSDLRITGGSNASFVTDGMKGAMLRLHGTGSDSGSAQLYAISGGTINLGHVSTAGAITNHLTMETTGSFTFNKYIIIAAQDTAHEGGELLLKGAGNNGGTAWPDWALDLWQNRFRVHSAGTVHLEITNSGMTSTAALQTSGYAWIGRHNQGSTFTYASTASSDVDGAWDVGQVTQVTEDGVTTKLRYDSANGYRLSKSITVAGGKTETLTFTYDASGNMTGYSRTVA